MMKCSVFIATSIDGFIATKDGNVDWLHTSEKYKEIIGEQAESIVFPNDYVQLKYKVKY